MKAEELELGKRVKNPKRNLAGTLVDMLPNLSTVCYGVRWDNGEIEELDKSTADKLVNLSDRPISKDDVWGDLDMDTLTWKHRGMVVAQGKPMIGGGYKVAPTKGPQVPSLCPYFGVELGYKSVTVVCRQDQVDEVIYWLEYVHGAGAVDAEKNLDDGKVAILSSYKCW